MSSPCVLAHTLPEARRLLAAAGVRLLEIKQTAPPHGGPSGPLRVVRERATSEGVYLVAAASIALDEERDCHD